MRVAALRPLRRPHLEPIMETSPEEVHKPDSIEAATWEEQQRLEAGRGGGGGSRGGKEPEVDEGDGALHDGIGRFEKERYFW